MAWHLQAPQSWPPPTGQQTQLPLLLPACSVYVLGDTVIPGAPKGKAPAAKPAAKAGAAATAKAGAKAVAASGGEAEGGGEASDGEDAPAEAGDGGGFLAAAGADAMCSYPPGSTTATSHQALHSWPGWLPGHSFRLLLNLLAVEFLRRC